jgi:hypothetical protein
LKYILVASIAFLFSFSTSLAQVIDLKGSWRFNIGDDPAYAATAYNDSRWKFIKVPSTWEDQGFHGYDGFAWYRVKFDGLKLDNSEIYYLNLGYIDDADEVYLNGQLIGFSGQFPPKFKTAYNNERRYVLPAPLINFKGTNTIAIRVFDAMHGGGIVDGSVGIFGMNEGQKILIDLQGLWSFAKSNHGERIENENEWDNIMVPGEWEHQGFSKYDGFAWYKRSFTLPANFTKQDVVIMLGKIDDFDKTYLNGKLIGSTSDFRDYGDSHSYERERVYDIPQQLLKRNGTNIIEVLVEDMGNIGGIYEGPIGITTKSNYDRYFKQ